MVKNVLAVVCSGTLIATGYLTLSLLVLNPPRANFQAWLALAAVLVVQSVATMAALAMPRPPAALRTAVAVGAIAFVLIAVWRVRATLAGTHFEGYNLLLGAMLAVQGVLTIAAFLRRRPLGIAG